MENINLENIIDKAIMREEEAFDFYSKLGKTVADPTAKDALKFLADQEKGHKEFLVSYKSGKTGSGSLRMTEVIDYKVAQHLDNPDIEKDLNTKDVYLVAAHRELNSYNFYKGLAEIQPAGEVKEMLFKMANEELKHKEKVEYLYTNTAFLQTEGG
ncbi:MAG: ferritin family protein [Spirochaetes bacterium]|jgi:rubrerythrin|nr:ferritin family protein [Spirochaetota bacterium]